MKTVTVTRLFFIIIFIFALLTGFGCGMFKSVYSFSSHPIESISGAIAGEKAVLTKRTLVAPFENHAGIKQEMVSRIGDRFGDLLRKEDHISVTMLEGFDRSYAVTSSPQYGVVIDQEIVKKAEEIGMDILITATVDTFDVVTKKGGLWPFRRMKKQVTISVSMNVLDIINGTLVRAETENRKIKMAFKGPEDQYETWEVDYNILDEELSSILEDQLSGVSEALGSIPWTGKIKLTDNNNVMINGGKDVGITEGSVFEVFEKSEPIQSLSGKEYFFLGAKQGEIRAEEVKSEYTIAVPLNNEILEDGQLVRLKS
jgi:hypothetical protein